MSKSHTDWSTAGAYSIDQAARLLNVRAAMVSRWIYGSGLGCAAIVPEQSTTKQLITFLDLIQIMAIKEIRTQKRVSLQKIRETVKYAQKLDIAFPFARKHRTYVFSDDVVLRLDDGTLIQVTGKYSDSVLMKPIVYYYLDDIGFDAHGLATTYTPLRKAQRSIQLTPSLNCGSPTVHPCGYTVATLVDAMHAEGSKERAADVCGINPLDIQLAITYEQQLAA